MTAIEPTTDREEWQTSDDYGPAWRNPAFQPPVSANGLGDQIATNGRESTTHVCRNTPLSRDGGEPR